MSGVWSCGRCRVGFHAWAENTPMADRRRTQRRRRQIAWVLMDSIRVFKGLGEDAWSSFDIYRRDSKEKRKKESQRPV